MDKPIKVAVVRGDRRRGAVAEALALLAPEVAECVGRDRDPVIIPDLANPARPWSCTHRDTLSATLDAILACGAASARLIDTSGVASAQTGSTPATLGYNAELWGRPVEFPAVDQAPECWKSIRWLAERSVPLTLRVQSGVAESRCRISLVVAKTHQTYRIGLGMANLVGTVHPDDRERLGGLWPPGLVGPARGLLLGPWLRLRSISGGMRLTATEKRWLETVERGTDQLVSLSALLKPSLSVIDGFSAMHGEGPRHGRRVGLGTIIAGTDAVAVDAVAASIMGFDPLRVACLRQAHEIGLGTADLAQVTIVGDEPSGPRRRLRRHSADPLLRLAGLANEPKATLPRPHFAARSAQIQENADAHRI